MTTSSSNRRDSRRARPVYVISVAADLAGVHAQTLRSYERHGLVEPARTPGGDRRYSDEDLDRVARVTELSGQGITSAASAGSSSSKPRSTPCGPSRTGPAAPPEHRSTPPTAPTAATSSPPARPSSP